MPEHNPTAPDGSPEGAGAPELTEAAIAAGVAALLRHVSPDEMFYRPDEVVRDILNAALLTSQKCSDRNESARSDHSSSG
jgi:hypothetical protein